MSFLEEKIARDLYRELTHKLQADPKVKISITGGGVHWSCTARRGKSLCTISCFNQRGPQYYTSFERASKRKSTARSRSIQDTIAAATDWLKGMGKLELYERYAFVDHDKRALLRIRDALISRIAELQEDKRAKIVNPISDSYELRLTLHDRSCEVSFYGEYENPDARFLWDDCPLFTFRLVDQPQFADILERWLSDGAMPTTMLKEFPWLEFSTLAEYYENGNPIEGEFIHSWDAIEEFYKDFDEHFAELVLKLIADMRVRGYDKTLRAGQSLWFLILSRSRRHGLDPKQSVIHFRFGGDLMSVSYYAGKQEPESKIEEVEIRWTTALEDLLKELEATPID